MIRIHQNFTGGNISVKEITDTHVTLENELRDTVGDWFYWAFCVEGAENQTITFQFQQKNRIGYYGPAISHDLIHWYWLYQVEGESFTYHFGAEEHKVYFAHHMLYHPDRFFTFAKENGLTIQELCKGRKGSSVPCVEFGSGSHTIILTARHHACESTGSYVLEGVLEQIQKEPIPDTKVFCVPFIDYDGVLDGDQGKQRAPYDHAADYRAELPCIYPETAALRKHAEENGCEYAFDFHSPYHKGNVNDHCFIVQKCHEKLAALNRFGEILEQCITDDSLKYHHSNDFPPDVGWNKSTSPTFAVLNLRKPDNKIAFTLETTYFGTPDNIVGNDGMLELGRCFVKALKRYIETEG